MQEPVRLQKFLSQKGFFSRRTVEDMIRHGEISVNGVKATLGDKVGEDDIIAVKGKILEIPKTINQVVLAYYKPRGIEVTMQKNTGDPTIGDIDFGVGRVFPVGRLDKDSHGLIFLTNDGDLANKLAHPKFQKEKEYLVAVKKSQTADIKYQISDIGKLAKKLSEGVQIEEKMTKPCQVEVVEKGSNNQGEAVLRFLLKEGRNRQIRRMCEAVGLKVVDLLRIRIGKIVLGEMKMGKWRRLSEVEIGSL